MLRIVYDLFMIRPAGLIGNIPASYIFPSLQTGSRDELLCLDTRSLFSGSIERNFVSVSVGPHDSCMLLFTAERYVQMCCGTHKNVEILDVKHTQYLVSQCKRTT